MFQEKIYHDSVAFSLSSIQDVKLLESSTSSYLVVDSSSGYHHFSRSVYEQLLRMNKLAE